MTGNQDDSDYLRYASIAPQFPRLEVDSATSCPFDLRKIPRFKYFPWLRPWDTLCFLRTARVKERDYWLWELHTVFESDEEVWDQYFAVSVSASRPVRVTWRDKSGLTPEQFILADYNRDVFCQMPAHWLLRQVSIDDLPSGDDGTDLRGEMLPGDEVWEFGYNEGPMCAGYGFVLVRNGKTKDHFFKMIS